MSRLQRGYTLIVAVFLITALAALGLFIVQIGGLQHQTTMLAGLGTQGYYAARAGAEWAVFSALDGQPCNNTFAAGTLAGTMSDYQVTVTCSSTSHTIAGDDPITVWAVTSIAVRGSLGDLNHVSRTVTISFTDAS
jgi:MSHA biogenesis protein MshP